MKKHSSVKGLVFIAFGAGLFLSYCFPTKFIIITLAVMLIIVGIFSLKC